MGRVTRRPQAILDLIEQATYIARDRPQAAERFRKVGLKSLGCSTARDIDAILADEFGFEDGA